MAMITDSVSQTESVITDYNFGAVAEKDHAAIMVLIRGTNKAFLSPDERISLVRFGALSISFR